MRVSRIRRILCACLAAFLTVQCAPVVFAGYTYTEYGEVQDGAEPALVMQASAALPSKYDLRDYGLVTPVKNQGAAKNCWSFAAVASLESSYIKQGYGTAADTDFSEAHLVWFAQNQRTTDTSDPTYGDGLNCKNPFATGGNWYRVAATLIRGAGLQLEQNAPWTVTYNTDELLSKMAQKESDRYISYARMWGVQSIPDGSITAFKQKIMQNGAATLSYYHDIQPTSGGQTVSPGYDSNKFSYNQNAVSGRFNHSVAVVGWDDNYSKNNFKIKPSQNGAWLVKGSWGEGYGDHGYYWLSYYDSSITQMASYVAARADAYDHIYQYDGARPKTAVSPQNSGRMANVFTAQRDEALTHVAFYSPNENPVTVTAEIYVLPQGKTPSKRNPTAGMDKIAAATTTVQNVERGYTTVELAAPTLLRKNQSFSVVLTFSLPGKTVDVPMEGIATEVVDAVEAYSAKAGQSFIGFVEGSGTRWYDTTDYGGQDYHNVPLKAMTRDVTLQEPTLTLASAPTRTTYRVGDTLDSAGLSLVYTDRIGQSQTVTKDFVCTPTTLTEIGTQTVTVSYDGLQTTFDVTVEPYETNLSLLTLPDRTAYMVGDALDTAGLTLLYTDVYNREHTVTQGFVCEPETLSAIGRQTVHVTYAGKSVTFDVTAEPYETSLTVLTAPDKTVYMVGGALNTAGLTLLYTDEYNAQHTVGDGFVCTPQILNTIGTQIVTVTYGTASAAFPVTVEPYEKMLAIASLPAKTTYLYGETLDTTGLSLVYSDEYGDTFAVTEGFSCSVGLLAAFGTQTVTVTYNGLSTTFDVTVEPHEQTLTLVTPPVKTEYLYGDTLDMDGLSLLYRDEYGEAHTVSDGFTCDVQTLDVVDMQTVTVTYAGLSVTFDVTVDLHEPTLTLLTAPDKTVYFASEPFDSTGMTLLYTDEFGTAMTVSEGFTCAPGTLRVLGTQTVTVKYRDLTVTFDVTVEPLEPTLTLKIAPDKTAYLIGEPLDTAGLALLYTNEIGDALVVTEGFTCDPAYFSKVGDQTVTVAYHDLTVTFNVSVDLREPTLTVVSMPDRTRYFEGDSLDLTGLKLVYSDEYGNVTEITDGFTCEEVTFEQLGYQTVTLTYADLTVSFEVKVILTEPTLTLSTLPHKTAYLYGEMLDTTGLTLVYTDDFGEQTTVTEGFVCTPESACALGTQTVEAAYLGLSVSFEVTVEPLEPTLTIMTPPKTTAYLVGDTLDPTGLALLYTDEYGDALVVTEGFTCDPTQFSVFGPQTVTATYNGITASFNVMISAYEPTLTVVTMPDKTTYLVGDLLETEGLTLLYTDEYNTEHTVTYGFIYDVHLLSGTGTQTVTVTYSDASVSFDVQVEPYEPTLTVVRLPEQTTYMVRQTLDTTGLTLRYTDEYNEERTVSEGFVCSPHTLRTLGTQTVTVTYEAVSATFDVQVLPYETTLTLLNAPLKTTYHYGETLDTTGLSLLYTDEYGDALAVTGEYACDVTTLTAFGMQTVTVTYADRSVTFDVTVEPHEKTLTILTPPDKTTYLYGETLDTAGLSLQYKDEYGVLHTVTEDFVCDAGTLDALGVTTVTAAYAGLSVTFNVTVEPHAPTLTLVTPPDKTVYLATEAPDMTGMSLVYTDEYGASFDVTQGYTVAPEALRTLGTQTVTVTYEGLSVAFDVTVEPLTPTLMLQFTPAKMTYLTGESPDTAGLTLLYTDEVGDAHTVTDGFTCAPDVFRVAGIRIVTVTYKGLNVTFNVTVKARPETLTLRTPPAKTAYLIGDTLDTAGLSLAYTDMLGATQILTDGFTCTPAALDTAGTQTVTVTYKELSVTFDVTVTLYTPTLTVKSPPAKTTYFVGETPDTTGLSLDYTDDHGVRTTVTDGFACTPQKFTKSGAQTVTVTYAGLSAAFSVTVRAVEADSIRVVTRPNNTSYTYRRDPDFSGLTVSVHYNDGHEETISDLSKMSIRPESDARVRRGSRTFVVTAQGKSATFTMDVKLAWWQWLILIFLFGFIWY